MNLLQDAFEQVNGFSSLTADELFFINGGCIDTSGGGNSSGTPTSWGSPANDYTMAKIANTATAINNAVGSAIVNGAPVVAKIVASAALAIVSKVQRVLSLPFSLTMAELLGLRINFIGRIQ